LENAPPEAAEELIEALAGQGAVAAPRIASRLTNEKLRMLAARVLLRMGPDAVAAVPQLVESLDTDDPKFKAEVQFVLGTIGPEAAAAVPTLVASLSDENLEVRRSAIFALGRMGPAAAEAAPALRKFGRADDQFHRLGAVWALVQIETGNTELRRRAIPLFVRALGDDRFEIRRIEVARVLGLIGPLAKPAVPALQKALQDPSPRVRRAAEEALKRIQQ